MSEVAFAFGYVFSRLGPSWRVTRARKVENAGKASIGQILLAKLTANSLRQTGRGR